MLLKQKGTSPEVPVTGRGWDRGEREDDGRPRARQTGPPAASRVPRGLIVIVGFRPRQRQVFPSPVVVRVLIRRSSHSARPGTCSPSSSADRAAGGSARANLCVLLGRVCSQPLAFGCRACVTVTGLVTFWGLKFVE